MSGFSHRLLLCPKIRLDALGLHYNFWFVYTSFFIFYLWPYRYRKRYNPHDPSQVWSNKVKLLFLFLQIHMKWWTVLKSTVLGAGFWLPLCGGAEYNKWGGGGCGLPLHHDWLPNQRGSGTDPKTLSPSRAGLSWVSEANWPTGESKSESRSCGYSGLSQSSRPGYVTASGKQFPHLHRRKKSLGNVRPIIRLHKENKVDPKFAIY